MGTNLSTQQQKFPPKTTTTTTIHPFYKNIQKNSQKQQENCCFNNNEKIDFLPQQQQQRIFKRTTIFILNPRKKFQQQQILPFESEENYFLPLLKKNNNVKLPTTFNFEADEEEKKQIKNYCLPISLEKIEKSLENEEAQKIAKPLITEKIHFKPKFNSKNNKTASINIIKENFSNNNNNTISLNQLESNKNFIFSNNNNNRNKNLSNNNLSNKNNNKQLLEQLLYSFSRNNNISSSYNNVKRKHTTKSRNSTKPYLFKITVSSLLTSPKTMSSPFRGLRRAASNSASTISCCSSASSTLSSALSGSITGAGFAYPYPRSHTTLMLLPTATTVTTRNNNPIPPTTSSLVCTPSATSSRYGSRDLFQSETDLDYENNNNFYQQQQQNLISSSEFKEDNNNNNNNVESVFEPPSDYCNIIPKRRPPLNRAIPPIPESKSNESIISAQSNSLASAANRRLNNINRATVIKNFQQEENLKFIKDTNESSTMGKNSEPSKLQNSEPKSKKESKLPKLKSSNKKKTKPNEVPKSPLLSVAHTVRTRLSKFAPKFGSTSPTPIRSSISLGTIKRGDTSIEGIRPTSLTTTTKLAKSSSMESSNTTNQRPLTGVYQQHQQPIDSSIPRRMPTTTLIPLASPARGPVIVSSISSNKRSPPTVLNLEKVSEIPFNKEEQKELTQISSSKQTQFEDESTTNQLFILKKDPSEIEYVKFDVIEEKILAPKKFNSKNSDILNEAIILELIDDNEAKEIPIVEDQQPTLFYNNEEACTSTICQISPLTTKKSFSSPSKISANDLWSIPIGLRKTPQSFPPMQISPNIITTSKSTTDKSNLSAKSVLSVSFCPEAKQSTYNIKSAPSKVDSSRGLFSTRSLRLAASKIAEASPRLRRRNKSVSDASRSSTPTALIEPTKPIEAPKPIARKKDTVTITIRNNYDSNQSSRRKPSNIQKSASLPESKKINSQKKLNKKDSKRLKKEGGSALSLDHPNNNNNKTKEEMKLIKKIETSFQNTDSWFKDGQKKSELRTIKSVLKKKSNLAPLAEIESSRVAENSPAVEIPPVNFSFGLLNSLPAQQQQQRRRFLAGGQNLFRQNFLNKTTKKSTTTTNSSLIMPDINVNIRLDVSDLNELEKINNNNLPVNNNKTEPFQRQTLAELLASPPPPLRKISTPKAPYLILDGIEAEPFKFQEDEENLTPRKQQQQQMTAALDSHRSGLIDDEIGDQPMLISTSDFALIDELSQASSSVFSSPKHRQNIPTKSTMLRYVDDSSLASSSQFSLENSKISTRKKSINNNNFENKFEKSNIAERNSSTNLEKSQKINGNTGTNNNNNNNNNNNTNGIHKFFNKSSFKTAKNSTNNSTINGKAIIDNLAACSLDDKSVDDIDLLEEIPFQLPELLTDFKAELTRLQDAMKKDYDEIEKLRSENYSLRNELEERDELIRNLRTQLRQ